MTYRTSAAALAALLVVQAAIGAQDRLKSMPGHDPAQRVARDAPEAITGVVTGVTWVGGGRAFECDRDGTHYKYDIARGRATEADAPSAGETGRAG